MASKIKLSTIMLRYPSVSTMKVIRILSDLGIHATSTLNTELTEQQAKVFENILAIEQLYAAQKNTKKNKSKTKEPKVAPKQVVNTHSKKVLPQTVKKYPKQKNKQPIAKTPRSYYTPIVVKPKPRIFVIKKKDDDIHEKFIRESLPGVSLPLISYDAIKKAVKLAEERVCLNSNLLLHIYHHLDDNSMLQKFFFDNIVDNYVKTKILTKRTGVGQTYDRQLLDLFNTRSNNETALDLMKSKEFILNWNDVIFGDRFITINPPRIGNIKFAPLNVPNKMSIMALNSIREFLQNKMPEIHCMAKENKLTILDKIDLSVALRYLKIKSTKPTLDPETDGLEIKEKRNVPQIFKVQSFEDALSQASKFDKHELSKLKSQYINYLAAKQSDNYKVVPCSERMSYESSFMTNIEFAFIFTLPSSKQSHVILAVENLNIDRSTMLFSFRRRYYEKVIRGIYGYLQSFSSNKRSELRKWKRYGLEGVEIEYHAVNHRSSGQYSWFEIIRYRLRTM